MLTYSVLFSSEAKNDLRDIYAFIARDSVFYGEKVTDTITDWCEQILSVVPHIGRVLSEEKVIREATESTY
jgi:plasmid stabilization system protein ParE